MRWWETITSHSLKVFLSDSVGWFNRDSCSILFYCLWDLWFTRVGKGILQILKYTLEGSGPISRHLTIITFFAFLCPLLCSEGEKSLLYIIQIPFMFEVFYENRSATWQHPIIPRSFFFILLSMTYLSGALIVELFIINILMTFFYFKDKAKER